MFFIRNNLAAVYRAQGKYDSAKNLIKQDLAGIDKAEEKIAFTANLMSFARLHLEFDVIDEAASVLDRVKPMVESLEASNANKLGDLPLFYQITMGQLKLKQYEFSSALEHASIAKRLIAQITLDYPVFRLTDMHLLLIQVHMQLWLLNRQEYHMNGIKASINELKELKLKESWFQAYIESILVQGVLKRAEFDLNQAQLKFKLAKEEATKYKMEQYVKKAQNLLDNLQDQIAMLQRLYKASPQAYEQAQMLDVIS